MLQIAAALKAEKLILMTDVPGVLQDKDDIGTKYTELSIRQTRELVASGIIAGGMIPKCVNPPWRRLARAASSTIYLLLLAGLASSWGPLLRLTQVSTCAAFPVQSLRHAKCFSRTPRVNLALDVGHSCNIIKHALVKHCCLQRLCSEACLRDLALCP